MAPAINNQATLQVHHSVGIKTRSKRLQSLTQSSLVTLYKLQYAKRLALQRCTKHQTTGLPRYTTRQTADLATPHKTSHCWLGNATQDVRQMSDSWLGNATQDATLLAWHRYTRRHTAGLATLHKTSHSRLGNATHDVRQLAIGHATQDVKQLVW